MTHTLHRIGDVESLKEDYIVQLITSKQIKNRSIRSSSIERFKFTTMFGGFAEKLLKRYPTLRKGIEKALLNYSLGPQIIRKIQDSALKFVMFHLTVFNNEKEFTAYITRLMERNLGPSVVVSGLFDNVYKCLGRAGIHPHTVQFSLGIFGRVDRLPREEILQITTMCGHHLISAGLTTKLFNDVKKGKITPERAAAIMGKQCICGAFNEKRAARVIRANTA